jgi:SWI/SNF-related matrix-associated actin-dependent regulator 1 of chromatin subfamily A
MANNESTIDFNGFLPSGESLFDYQQVGVAYALVTKRCFIADEMGLGKTRQALVALEAGNVLGDIQHPAVIVCPASLKGNWENEVKRCLPNRTVQVLFGNRPYETLAEIVIINYDILADWADVLDPSALVLDESHYVKNPGTAKKPVRRTAAAKVLAARVPASGLVLLLTGTPIMNRPVELVTQLQILGQLEKVSPRPRKGQTDRDWEYAFKFSFCGPKHNGHGYEFKGSSKLGMLNERLRSSCMVRRLRADVLNMNDTVRIEVPFALNGALDTYRAAEADFLSFIEREGGREAAVKASRALVITQMNKLRLLAGQAKIEASVEWVKNFFEQNEGRSLVAFAWHKEVQAALIKANPGCATITDATKDVEAEKAKFLSGEAKLIVVSILKGQAGHTLVGPNIDCHDVVFFQQGWNPGTMQQAEDRINRIGQTSQWVFAHNVIAAGTIEEHIASVIESKRAVFNAAINGAPLDADELEGSVQEEVLRRLLGK